MRNLEAAFICAAHAGLLCAERNIAPMPVTARLESQIEVDRRRADAYAPPLPGGRRPKFLRFVASAMEVLHHASA